MLSLHGSTHDLIEKCNIYLIYISDEFILQAMNIKRKGEEKMLLFVGL